MHFTCSILKEAFYWGWQGGVGQSSPAHLPISLKLPGHVSDGNASQRGEGNCPRAHCTEVAQDWGPGF